MNQTSRATEISIAKIEVTCTMKHHHNAWFEEHNMLHGYCSHNKLLISKEIHKKGIPIVFRRNTTRLGKALRLSSTIICIIRDGGSNP